jgi:transcriptional regulator with XRE-family HTH domain
MLKLPIRDWCDALGISQAALAKRAGMTASVVSDYAHGRRNPTVKSLTALARALAREPWEFLRGPLAGEGLPSEDDAREANVTWFRKLTPSQKARASETSRKMALHAAAYARQHGGSRARSERLRKPQK